MRWCSREEGIGACCCWASFGAPGSAPGGAPIESSDELQPARPRPSSATSASRRAVIAGLETASRACPICGALYCGTRASPSSDAIHPLRKKFFRKRMDPRAKPGGDTCRCETAVCLTAMSTTAILRSVPFGDLDLLGMGRLDPRPAALFDPSAHPHAAIFELSRVDAGGGEGALIAFQDGDRQSLRPAPPEIHIYGAAALANGQHLAFHHREMAALGVELCPVLGRHDGIIRFAPEAKLGVPRAALARQQLRGAGPGICRDPRKSALQ